MSVQAAVEKADQARAEVAQQKRPPTPAEALATTIKAQADAFRAVLPASTDPDRFSRLVLNACKQNPKLIECFSTQAGGTSLLMSAMQAATMGVEPNTPAQEAWLLPRNVKSPSGQWHVEAELSIGYRGYLKLMRNTGGVRTAFADVVYERDHFAWSRGLEQDEFDHKPFMGSDRGELLYAYAVIRYERGGYDFVVLTRPEVEARRAKSDSWKNERSRPYSPWTTAPAAMWRKSAMRELSKWVELSPEVRTALASDEAPLRFDPDAGVIEAVETPPQAVAVLAPVPDAPQSVEDDQPEAPDGEDDESTEGGESDVSDPEDATDGAGPEPAPAGDPIETTSTEPEKGTPKGAYFARQAEAARLAEVTGDVLRKRLVLILTDGQLDSASGWPDHDDRWVGLNRLIDRMLERGEIPYPKASGGWELKRLPGGQDADTAPTVETPAPEAGEPENEWLGLDGEDWQATVRQAGLKAVEVLRAASDIAHDMGQPEAAPGTLARIAEAPADLRIRLGEWLREQAA